MPSRMTRFAAAIGLVVGLSAAARGESLLQPGEFRSSPPSRAGPSRPEWETGWRDWYVSDRAVRRPDSSFAPRYDPEAGDLAAPTEVAPDLPPTSEADVPAANDHWLDDSFEPHGQHRLRHKLWDSFFGVPYDGRHRKLGHPLSRESWLTRPYHVDAFIGGLFADDPLDGQAEAGTGFVGGGRLGWDWHTFWVLDTRLFTSSVALEDPTGSTLPEDMRVYTWDLNLLYFPLGDAQWRPYVSAGLGFYDVEFARSLTEGFHETLFSIPWGFGCKYRVDSRLALRVDLIDNVAFGDDSRLETMHNWSLTGGFEWHFGGGPKASYFPWNPSRNWW